MHDPVGFPGITASRKSLLVRLAAAALLAAGLILGVMFLRATAAGATGELSYYFPIYSNSGDYQSTIVIGNVGSGATDIEIDVAGTVQYTDTLAAEQSIEWRAAGLNAGPVEIKSLSGQSLSISQRVIYKNSVTETYAAQQLDTDYYFPWYDEASAGASSQIIIANPGTSTATMDVYLQGMLQGSYSVGAEGFQTVSYPGVMDGPVQVVGTNGQPFIVGQRSIFGDSVHDLMGIGEASLSSDYVWTLYDDKTPGTYCWVLISNPGATPAYAEITIAGTTVYSGTINPGAMVSPRFPGVIGGPVEVKAWTDVSRTTPTNVIATTSWMMGGGIPFREYAGTPAASLGQTFTLSRFDNSDPGLTSHWIIANPSATTSTVDVYVGANATPRYVLTMPPNSFFNGPTPDATEGPVRIISREGLPVIASQDYTMRLSRNYYFPWYDNVYGYTWLLMAQPQGSGNNTLDAYLKSNAMESGISVGDGTTMTRRFAGQFGGPVKVFSLKSKSLVSERSLFGNSFEEVWSTPYEQLDSHYYWPDYIGIDGIQEWVLVSNPQESSGPIDAYLHILTLPQKQGDPKPPDINLKATLQPGESWTPIFPNMIGEAVEVKTCVAGGNPDNSTDARKSITSERMLADGGFNEMAGIPASHLQDTNMWTWFDNISSDGDMIFVGNPNTVATVYADIWIGGAFRAELTLRPGLVNVWPNPSNPQRIMDGPVEVRGCTVSVGEGSCSSPAPIYASQSSQFGPAYEETAGIVPSELKPTANWTWYDEQSTGSLNWVLVANPNGQPIYYRITIAGQVPAGYIGAPPQGTINPGQRVTPRFPGIMGGPVKVEAWYDGVGGSQPANVLASQRVLWNGFFNEVVGEGL